MNDWRVRTKLAVVLTVPALSFLMVATILATTAVSNAVALRQLSKRVALGRPMATLIHELQRERDQTAGMLAALSSPGGAPRTVADLAPDRIAVDRALAALREAARPALGDSLVAGAYRSVGSSLRGLTRLRSGVDGGWLRERAAFDAYTEIIGNLLRTMPRPAVGDSSTVTSAVWAVANLAVAKEYGAQIRGRLYAVTKATSFAPGEYEIIANIRAERAAALQRFRERATPSQLAAYDDVVTGQAVRNADRLQTTILDNAQSLRIGVDAQQWWQASTTELELTQTAETQLLERAIDQVNQVSSLQWRRTLSSLTLFLALLFLALLISVIVGRSTANSLRSLRDQARAVAKHRLPSVLEQLRGTARGAGPIDVQSISIQAADEVGEVAQAFTEVHTSAVRLAVEQAMMRENVNAIFVNLARRSQTLVERQLQLLDALESAETDPEQLSNLFRLDHLATRMRRNDENLLVLAGGDASRRWREPVSLTVVVTAAVAEIEQYTRVRRDIADDVCLAGHVVADLVHLIAELLENATTFSAPDTTVSVLGWSSPEGGAVLVIQDDGIGMSAEEMARVNAQLDAPVSIDVAAAERMGLVVVGHLASRYGIKVELRSAGPRSGVAAMVTLPAAMLAPAPSSHQMLWTAPSNRLALPATAHDQHMMDPPPALPARPAPVRATATVALATPTPTKETTPAKETAIPTPAKDAPTSLPRWPANDRNDRPLAGAERRFTTGDPVARVTPARRGSPTRAEDVLDAARAVDPPSVWWSKDRHAAPARPAPAATPRQVTDGGTSEAGLPIRIPMAQLPNGQSTTEPGPPEPDPERVGAVLSGFYGGVHRATTEDEGQ